jgi:hypothetical protein
MNFVDSLDKFRWLNVDYDIRFKRHKPLPGKTVAELCATEIKKCDISDAILRAYVYISHQR